MFVRQTGIVLRSNIPREYTRNPNRFPLDEPVMVLKAFVYVGFRLELGGYPLRLLIKGRNERD